ncbi:MAG: hypothetical protein K6T65_11305 [Peptococcaceae bacterium]|nr:hypothetical protein [Peptococcaceae bacterium]
MKVKNFLSELKNDQRGGVNLEILGYAFIVAGLLMAFFKKMKKRKAGGKE